MEGGAAVCDERLREGRGGQSLSILPYFNLNCSMICTSVTVEVKTIILSYLLLERLQVVEQPSTGTKAETTEPRTIRSVSVSER